MLTKRITNPILRTVVEWLLAIGFAVIMFFVIRSFLFRIAHVDGNSMSPTLDHGDMVVLNRLSYFFTAPRAGDIVAFPVFEDRSVYYIKRIVAVPGDIVDFRENNFYINGSPLDDAFSAAPVLQMGDVSFPLTVEEGRYFVLGDNRNGSRDSRFSSVGTITARDFVGKVAVRIWPFNRLGRVE